MLSGSVAVRRLPNRTLLLDRLNQALFRVKRQHDQLALRLLDLGGFKNIVEVKKSHIVQRDETAMRTPRLQVQASHQEQDDDDQQDCADDAARTVTPA